MGRDKSPKRLVTVKFEQIFALVKNFCSFKTQIAVYQSARSLWPLFSHIQVKLKFLTQPYIQVTSLDTWQTLLKCFYYWDIFPSTYNPPLALRLAILSTAFGNTEIPKAIDWELNGTLYNSRFAAAAINGRISFLKSWQIPTNTSSSYHSNLCFFVDNIPPLFDGSLASSFYAPVVLKSFKQGPRDPLSCFEYIERAIRFRLPHAIPHFNFMRKGPSKEYYCQSVHVALCFFYGRELEARIQLLIQRCEEWGHPEALKLIDSLWKPMLAGRPCNSEGYYPVPANRYQ